MKIAFLGDIYSEYETSQLTLDEDLRLLLGECDYVVCNLEGPILSPIKEIQPWKKAGPHLKQHSSIIDALNKFKVTHASLANNHAFDYGQEGLENTKKQLELNEIQAFGAGSFDESYEPVILNASNCKIAIFTASEAQFGCLNDTEETTTGYAWIHSRHLRRKILEKKREGYKIILFSHLGLEMVQYPLPEWRISLKGYIEDGVDIVINAHPHVIQGKESYYDKMVYYSLGNFYFNRGLSSKNQDWKQNMFLVLDVSEDRVEVKEYFSEFSAEKISLIDNEEKFKELSQALSMNDYNLMMDKIVVEKWYAYYQSYYGFTQRKQFISNRLIRKLVSIIEKKFFRSHDSVLLQHNLQIETHRYAVERALKKINQTY